MKQLTVLIAMFLLLLHQLKLQWTLLYRKNNHLVHRLMLIMVVVPL